MNEKELLQLSIHSTLNTMQHNLVTIKNCFELITMCNNESELARLRKLMDDLCTFQSSLCSDLNKRLSGNLEI